ncbi:ribosome-associated translation inhibitor RaiA [Acinetobacter qingfengensis]|uniref:Ribosome hibernation promoting factor n=1 Tax=Acinetobacter qingfengensis TaxID=1262585 RepID=A0A1E7RCB0_9GAMM|nr:ribosome-associated translation inhibitor RaiA [Acinetobacter qingfengensis]KAA8735079.1 ribosome-associated translation inhibitor RaiA [Acinetobacter qingfengensis]OEY97004.1 ribosomal subunit interface protein [Acinetobacter qingfengensis]
MQITIRGHHLAITPAIEEKITIQFSKLTKHLDQICSMQVKLQKDHRLTSRSHKGQDNHSAEIILRLPGKELFAQASADDMYQAINILAEKVRRQLERHKAAKLVA